MSCHSVQKQENWLLEQKRWSFWRTLALHAWDGYNLAVCHVNSSWGKVENSPQPINRLEEPEWPLFCPKKPQLSVKGLGKLVCTQRTNEKNDQLSECRKKPLNDISFEWDDHVSVVQRLQKQPNCSLHLTWANECCNFINKSFPSDVTGVVLSRLST